MIATNPDAVFCPYAVGDVLTTSSPTLPSERWPGTVWQQIKDTFLLAAGDSYAAGSTGGEAKHTLTQAELPKIVGQFGRPPIRYSEESSARALFYGNNELGPTITQEVDNPSGGNPHNNMPPYRAYYMWERTK